MTHSDPTAADFDANEPATQRRPGRRTLVAVVAVITVVGAGITVLRLNDTWPFGEGGSTRDAFAYFPADATSVTFSDQVGTEERLGVQDIASDSSDAEFEEYLVQLSENPWAGNAFTTYLQTMRKEGAAFTSLDVVWSAEVRGETDGDPSGSYAQLFGMDPDLDLDAVADAMVEAGFDEVEVDGARGVTSAPGAADPLTGFIGPYPVGAGDLVMLPEEHLMISGPDAEWILDVVNGDADSLADEDDISDLLQDEDVEYVAISRGAGACTSALSPDTLGGRVTPETVEALMQDLEDADLGTADATAAFVARDGDDVTLLARLLFDDADQASDDRDARETYLDTATDLVTSEPLSGVIDVNSIETEGSLETVRYEYLGDRGPGRLFADVQDRNLAATTCVAR